MHKLVIAMCLWAILIGLIVNVPWVGWPLMILLLLFWTMRPQ